ncbi:MAG: serine protein kinase PrkA, partial [Bradymonadaceae bacterium]
MGDSEDVLEQLNAEFKQEYEATRRLMSFSEFLDAFTEHPRRFARNSVQYVRDCFLHYGTETRSRDWGDATHFNLFERPAEDGRNRLVGQQRVQERIFNLLESFARQGGPDKLMLLHGPNGSAKSSLIESLIGALEDYSRTEEGALYRFNWIFPGDQVGKGGSIGFDGFSTRKVEESDLETFAYLDEEDIDATIPSALNDHPLLLIPSEQRRDLLVEYIDNLVIPSGDVDGNPQLGEDRPADGAAYAEELDARDESDKPFVASDYIVDGDISHTSRQIFDALLNAYEGELEKVLRHVQVERFFISRRYRRGSVVIEPQHAV